MSKEFGIDDLAAMAGVEPASMRVKLRNAGVKKSGKTYIWKNKDEMKSVLTKLEKGSPKKEKAPAKKKAAKKPAKKAKKKAAPKKDEE